MFSHENVDCYVQPQDDCLIEFTVFVITFDCLQSIYVIPKYDCLGCSNPSPKFKDLYNFADVCDSTASRSTWKSRVKNELLMLDHQKRHSKYTAWKVDGATPMYWYWFIIAPYKSPPFGGCTIYFSDPWTFIADLGSWWQEIWKRVFGSCFRLWGGIYVVF